VNESFIISPSSYKVSLGSDIRDLPLIRAVLLVLLGDTLSQPIITELANLGDSRWTSTLFTQS
jgi:hypothetical protein